MYTYIFDGVGTTIHTPAGLDRSQIAVSVLEQSADCVRTRYAYPTGLVLEVTQTAKHLVIYSNRALRRNPDGSYSAE